MNFLDGVALVCGVVDCVGHDVLVLLYSYVWHVFFCEADWVNKCHALGYGQNPWPTVVVVVLSWCDAIEQSCPTRGPRATCGPPRYSMWPVTNY